MILLLFILSSWGAAYVITESKLFQRPRKWAEYIGPFVTLTYEKPDGTEGTHRTSYLALLVSCAACSGFWLGALVSWFALSPVTPYLNIHADCAICAIVHRHPRIVAAVLDGAIACGANYLGAMFVNEIGNAVLARLARKA